MSVTLCQSTIPTGPNTPKSLVRGISLLPSSSTPQLDPVWLAVVGWEPSVRTIIHTTAVN